MSSTASTVKSVSGSTQAREKVVMGLRSMDFIQHGTEAQLEIVTPLGQTYKFTTNFIGFDNQQFIFFNLPTIRPSEIEDFFVQGFNIDVEGVSESGEGALIKFRSKIEHVVRAPVPLLILKLPQQAKLIQLRNETRYELRLQGVIQLANRKLEVVLNDVSANGCGFSFDSIAPVFEMDHRVVIEVTNKRSDDTFALSGSIRNARRARGKQSYGVVFDDVGRDNCRRLLSLLIYDGSRYVFKQADKTALRRDTIE